MIKKTKKTPNVKPDVKPAVKPESSSKMKKQYQKNGTCKVTFILPAEAARDAKSVTIVGDFNDWDKTADPCKKLKNGDYTATLDLKPGSEYCFRYLINGTKWENDWCADKYKPNPHGAEDSVVIV